MQPKRKQRLTVVLLVISGIGIAAGLVLYALRQNIDWFYMPTEVAEGKAPLDHKIRVGGMVVKGSVKRQPEKLDVQFVLTDYQSFVTVEYSGLLPDLFREGQGIIAIGQLKTKDKLTASEVLAKHDENYMPPEVAKSLTPHPLADVVASPARGEAKTESELPPLPLRERAGVRGSS